MAQTNYTPISLYYTTTAAAVPTAGNLVNGELAINITDGKLYYKNNSAVVTLLASSGGASGDVVGPASSTDNALARFDLATGKLIQNSVGLLSDAGILTGLTGVTSSGPITLSSLTSGRVTYAGTAGLLQDSANLTFNGTTLTANTIGAFTLGGTVAGGGNQLNNVIIGTTTPLAGAFTTLSANDNTVLASVGNTKTVQIGSLAAPANVGQLQQVFNGAAAWGSQSTVGGETDFGWNFYYYGGFKSRLADVASRLSFNAVSGRVSFWTAPNPGSADAALTFTEALRIDATTGVTALGAMAVGNNLAVTGTLSATGQISGTNTASYQAIFSGWGPLESNATAGAIVVGGSSQNSGRGEIHYWNNSAPAPALYIDNTRNSTDGKVVVRLKTSATAVEAATFNIYGIGLTGATPSSGTGITFPATQSASSDANTLDDYEEGTWTPSIGGTATYTYQTGRYTKIGRMVYVSAIFQVNVIGTGSTAQITGLPFSGASGYVGAEASFSVSYFSSIASNVVTLYANATSASVQFYGLTAAAGSVAVISPFQNSTRIDFSGWYIAAN